ncbi:flagellar brake domain-containing protein [Alteromonas sp. S167]|uniref:flagellar brake domain-containing protein n=1 Tax=Alteromonas sp. S167 TaxID=3117402 RepID=UPI002FE3C2CC
MTENIESNVLNAQGIAALRTLIPGNIVDLQISMPAAPKRVKTEYVGMLIDECLMFHIPTSAKWITVRDALTVGNDVVVRSVLEGDTGQVIAFRVKVLKLISNPTGILITSFPKKIESIGLRSVKRSQLGVSIDITCEALPDEEGVAGIIVDLSAKGCKVALQSKAELPVLEDDTAVDIAYSLDGKEVKLAAVVKNYRVEKDVAYYGLAFNCDEKLIKTLLSRHTLLT